jgi:hypothetical protein
MWAGMIKHIVAQQMLLWASISKFIEFPSRIQAVLPTLLIELYRSFLQSLQANDG